MKSKVYFIQTENGEDISSIAQKSKMLFERAQFSDTIEEDDMVAIKLTFGERGNVGYLKPPIVKSIVDKIKEKKGKPLSDFWNHFLKIKNTARTIIINPAM